MTTRTEPDPLDRLIGLPELLTIVPYSKASLNRDPTFPKRVRIGKRRVAWRESEVRAWLKKLSAWETDVSF